MLNGAIATTIPTGIGGFPMAFISTNVKVLTETVPKAIQKINPDLG
jgi:hypothetical protein